MMRKFKNLPKIAAVAGIVLSIGLLQACASSSGSSGSSALPQPSKLLDAATSAGIGSVQVAASVAVGATPRSGSTNQSSDTTDITNISVTRTDSGISSVNVQIQSNNPTFGAVSVGLVTVALPGGQNMSVTNTVYSRVNSAIDEGSITRIAGLRVLNSGVELESSVAGGTVYANVYTNIEAPVVTFVTMDVRTTQMVSDNANLYFNLIQYATGPKTLLALYNGQIGSAGCSVDCIIGEISGPSPAVATRGTWTFVPGGITRRMVVGGSYSGGMRYCFSESCSISRGNGGVITALTGEHYYVTPADSIIMTITTPDSDYLAGGVWLYVGNNTVEVGAFMDGSQPFTQGNIASLTGNAHYAGDAAGLYVESTTRVDNFTGDANLTASFGNDPDGSDRGRIAGQISNINIGGQATAEVIDLNDADIGDANSGAFTGRANINRVGSSGNWGGQFYGNNGTGQTAYPGAVGGTFGVNSGNRSYIGIFGATRTTTTPPTTPPATLVGETASRALNEAPPAAAHTQASRVANNTPTLGTVGGRFITQSSNSDDNVSLTVSRTNAGGLSVNVTNTAGNRWDINSISHLTFRGTYSGGTGGGTVIGVGLSRQTEVNNVPGNLYVEVYSDITSTTDGDYLAGGMWAFIPHNTENTDAFQMGAFGYGSDPFPGASVMALTGEATYLGGLDGFYTSPTRAGWVEADVALTASFGTDSELGSISGRTYNERTDQGSFPTEIDMVGTDNINPDGSFSGTLRCSNNNDCETANGNWGGAFFGGDGSSHPNSAGGTFSGSMIDEDGVPYNFVGVFGARRQQSQQ